MVGETQSRTTAPSGLEVGFEYFKRFVPAYSHLYGNALNSYVNAKFIKPGSEIVTALIESWIEGVSKPAGETMDVTAGRSVLISKVPVTPSHPV